MKEQPYIEGFTGELAMPDRQQLDDAVLELLGISDIEERRRLLIQLYTEITALYRGIRYAEKESQRHRKQQPRRKTLTPAALAREIWDEANITEEPSEGQFDALATRRTNDFALQKKIVAELWRLWRLQGAKEK